MFTNSHHVRSTAATVWFTGLPSAGKTTLATALVARLDERGRRAQLLDGDQIRARLSPNLGYSHAERVHNIVRIGYLAELLASNGVFALAAVVSPYAHARDQVRAAHAAIGVPFLEIHVATPIEICQARDVKGLYARAKKGEITGLTGVDDPYESPEHPELVLTTDHSIDASCLELEKLLIARELL
ncbi:MAG: adenylyl-sulfate kinase [Corynebacteriales bacterium]|nr:adenylyl-sulfate kinase [Mycobacteriales bacterium]